jgi:hypothetical protein
MVKHLSSAEGGFWGFIIFVGFIVWGLTAFLGGEREGYVKYSDCRETINLPSDNLQVLYKKFTCTYQKTRNGIIMGGTCVHIDRSWSLFGSNSDTCDTAYVYEKKQESGHCTDKDYPYLHYDGMCYPMPE